MILDLTEYTSLLVKTGLTPTQFFICMLLHEKSIGNIKLYTEKNGLFNREDIKYLVDNDWILTTKRDYSQFEDFYVSPKFTSLVSLTEEEQGEEFWKEFPNWLLIGERKVSAKAIGKEDLIELYFKTIRNSVSLHNSIMIKLKVWKSKNNGFATMSIKNFVTSRHWESLEETTANNSEGFEL